MMRLNDAQQRYGVSTPLDFHHRLSAIGRNCEAAARPLRANLYPVAVWINYDALIITVAGTARTVDNRDSVVAETLGELIDKAL
jgi:hypothetical protein